MPSQYSSETKAEALALLRRGETALATANILGLPERTVSRWALRWREATDGDDSLLADEDTRIALRAGELIHDWLDAAEQLPPDQLLKHGLALNVEVAQWIQDEERGQRRDDGGAGQGAIRKLRRIDLRDAVGFPRGLARSDQAKRARVNVAKL